MKMTKETNAILLLTTLSAFANRDITGIPTPQSIEPLPFHPKGPIIKLPEKPKLYVRTKNKGPHKRGT